MPAPPPSAPPAGYYQQGTAPSAGWGVPGGEYQAATKWRSLRGLTTTLTVLLGIEIVVSVLIIAGAINHLSVLSDHDVQGVVIDADPVNDAANFPAAMILIFGLLAIAIFVLLIIWMYRAAKNNEALGRLNPRLGPGWAIGGWFIPVAWWVIPVLIFSDLWKGSDPTIPRGDPNWRRASGGSLPVLWGIAFFVMTVPRFFVGVGRNDEGRFSEVSDVRRSDIFEIVSSLGAIAAGALAIVVIRKVAARQEEALRAQQAAAGSSPSP